MMATIVSQKLKNDSAPQPPYQSMYYMKYMPCHSQGHKVPAANYLKDTNNSIHI